MDFLDKTYYGNSVLSYLLAVLLFIVLYTAIRIFRKIVLKRLHKWSEGTESTFDDFIVRMVERSVLPLLVFMAFYISVTNLNLSDRLEKVLRAVSVVVITFFALRLLISAIRYFIESKITKLDNSEAKLKQVKGIMTIITIVIWILGFVFLLDNFGYDITALVTGLGIGGIAIALAAQNILGDLFNYFVIFFDRPFEVGDFIIIDDKKGSVEAIGIKTSRIRSITGEQLVVANSDLSSSRVHNFKRMEKRRALFRLGVTYQTSFESLKIIPTIIKDIVLENADVEFDRAHFFEYGAFSLNFEVVYFIYGADYVKYMDIQQSINLRIFEEFSKRGIEFAYPTQTLFMANNKE
ncbi:MAG: mechanosensitive ion channel family protein [Bacteroidales bacterium]|nr:mechanosensitive ion channel family protein [Bacteroidales bacterium]